MNLYTRIILSSCLAASFFSFGCSPGGKEEFHDTAPIAPMKSDPIRLSSESSDSSEPAIATSRDGKVYIAWVEHRGKAADVMLARLTPDERGKEPAVRVNATPGEATAWRGDPPSLAITSDGSLHIGWTRRVESAKGHTTDIYLSSSRDGGKTFSEHVKVNDDQKPADRGLHSLAVADDGKIHLAWLDGRNVVHQASSMAGGHHTESNREVFISSSTDGGRTFSPNKLVASDICPCCKTSLAVAANGQVYLAWRQVLPGDFRHIAVASSTDGAQSFSAPVIVSDDQWVLKGCPVSGAALSATNGILRVLWYAGSENSQAGIYRAESTDGGKTFSQRVLVSVGFARSMPVLAASRDHTIAVWEASANGASQVHSGNISGARETVSGPAMVAIGELPAATFANDQMLVAYVVKSDEKRSIWLATNGKTNGK